MKRATCLLMGLVFAASFLLGACGGGVVSGPTSIPTLPAATLPPSSPAAPSGASGPANTPGTDLAAQGQQLVQQNGCLGCHSANGQSGTGPTWKGLSGSQVQLVDGTTVTADDNYLRQSIIAPNAQLAQGFPTNVMPQNYGQTLSDAQIQAIIAYIKSLK